MAELTHEKLSVAIREREDAGVAEIGVVVEGAFIPFGQVKVGDYREALQRAADEQAEREAAAPPEPPAEQPPAPPAEQPPAAEQPPPRSSAAEPS